MVASSATVSAAWAGRTRKAETRRDAATGRSDRPKEFRCRRFIGDPSSAIGPASVRVEDYLHKNSEVAEVIMSKINLNERIRKELASVKKLIKDKAKKVAIKVPKLKDCKYHLDGKHPRGDESMIRF